MKRFLIVVALLGLSACHAQLIPNTDVEDTPDNREIIDFLETYRRAVERRDTAALLKLAHADYYEDGGNLDSSDDLDLAGLEEYLNGRFSDAKAIRYEIRYRRVGVGRNDSLFVDYTYSASYKLPSANGDVWRRAVNENRIELAAHGDGYKILSGM